MIMVMPLTMIGRGGGGRKIVRTLNYVLFIEMEIVMVMVYYYVGGATRGTDY
jgi:hypothetical protein